MKLGCLVSLFSCWWIFVASEPANELVFPNDTSTHLLANWSRWQQEALVNENASTRSIRLQQALQYAAGIYENASKAKTLGLSNTVMVTLLTLTDHAAEGYKNILRNWLCYTAHYQHKPLIYYSYQPTKSSPSTLLETTLDDLRQYNPLSRFIDFPNALFWQLLTKKSYWGGTYGVKWKLDFRGSSISHAHFGSPLLKIVLMLEVVRSGYDCVYFDVDIAFVKDPIPLMIIGQNTVSITYESRYFPSHLIVTPIYFSLTHTPTPHTLLTIYNKNADHFSGPVAHLSCHKQQLKKSTFGDQWNLIRVLFLFEDSARAVKDFWRNLLC